MHYLENCMVLLLMVWPTGHMMVPITELWDSAGRGWGREILNLVLDVLIWSCLRASELEMTYVQVGILERDDRKRSEKQSGQQDKGCPVKEVIGCQGSYEVM